MAQDIKELLTHSLQDTYSAEQQALDGMQTMMEAATAPSLKQSFEQHIQETERQVERLERVMQMMGVPVEENTCEGMQGLIEEAEEVIDEMDPGPVLDAAIIAAAQKQEHYEIAAYGTLTAFAKAMGQAQAADLLAQTLKEEKDTDERLTMLAEQEINPAALQAGGGGGAANDPSGRSKGAA